MYTPRKDAFIRCRRDMFIAKSWPEMAQHLDTEHGTPEPESADKARKQGLILFTKSDKPFKLRKPFRLKKLRTRTGKPIAVRASAPNGVRASIVMQELIVPVYVRIPLAIGTISIVETIQEKESGK